MNTGLFDGVRFVHSARREAQRDAGHRASLCNDGDGPIWPTKGRVFASAGHRYDPLTVTWTAARIVPGRQTRKPGQMTRYSLNVL